MVDSSVLMEPRTLVMMFIMGLLIYTLLRWSKNIVNKIPTQAESFLSSRLTPGTDVLMSVYKVEWCPHCRQLKPSVDKLQALLRDRPVPGCQLEVVDCEKYPKVCRDAGVKSYPTILVTHPGRPVADPLPGTVDRQDPEALFRYLRTLAKQ